MRDEFVRKAFQFQNLVGPDVGEPTRGVLHTDGNDGPHSASGALAWGNRTKAFSIHYYVEGTLVYECLPERRLAYHVREYRKAEALGYPTTAPGVSKPRGDIGAIGIEHVMQPDGSWDQETRISSVLLGAEIRRRYPNLVWMEHAELDPWTRGNDVGEALYVPDWLKDVDDVIAGRTPYRTVGERASGRPYTGAVPTEPITVPPVPADPVSSPGGAGPLPGDAATPSEAASKQFVDAALASVRFEIQELKARVTELEGGGGG